MKKIIILIEYYDANTSTIAAFYNYSSASDHLFAWNIKINLALIGNYTEDQRRGILSHEFGHAVGLNDLQNSSNIGVLMYGYVSNSTYPTGADKTGAIEAAK